MGAGMLIADMFTGELTEPGGTIDLASGFDEFWLVWPKSTRKVARSQCLAKWISMGLCDHAAHIKAHVIWMRTQDDWTKQNGAFIPLVSTYLNQERWADWQPDERQTIDPVAATRELLAERDRNYRPPSADIKAKLQALRREMRT